MTGLNLSSQQGRPNHSLPSVSGVYDKVQRKNTKVNMDAQAISQLENPFILSDRRVTHDEEFIQVERKRKVYFCTLTISYFLNKK